MPYCGVRDETEFSYHGVQTPSPCCGRFTKEFYEYVYLRNNPRGDHEELWQHAGGCRSNLKVRRNTQTHEILGTSWPNEEIKERDHDQNFVSPREACLIAIVSLALHWMEKLSGALAG